MSLFLLLPPHRKQWSVFLSQHFAWKQPWELLLSFPLQNSQTNTIARLKTQQNSCCILYLSNLETFDRNVTKLPAGSSTFLPVNLSLRRASCETQQSGAVGVSSLLSDSIHSWVHLCLCIWVSPISFSRFTKPTRLFSSVMDFLLSNWLSVENTSDDALTSRSLNGLVCALWRRYRPVPLSKTNLDTPLSWKTFWCRVTEGKVLISSRFVCVAFCRKLSRNDLILKLHELDLVL